jgi:hypothetical protein
VNSEGRIVTRHSAQARRDLGQPAVSEARIRLAPWKSVRPFKGIFCHDISEFESAQPASPVSLGHVPLAKFADEPEFFRSLTAVFDQLVLR